MLRKLLEDMGQKGTFLLSLPHAGIRINREILSAGSTLFRVHRSRYAGDAFNGSARFSPLFDANRQR
ncbi:hypothetical protein EH228_02860 [Erwinia endophytica]|uniref:hypothetical protein n=1 Tax=Erwinia endophytica TaxID=1563158 RepID=UPI001265E7ED|nr:hypothetical protein [Erwinia endophytica]KAB8313103.1 hypothetical protein EH228_02860 [Erwinia endophytica]